MLTIAGLKTPCPACAFHSALRVPKSVLWSWLLFHGFWYVALGQTAEWRARQVFIDNTARQAFRQGMKLFDAKALREFKEISEGN